MPVAAFYNWARFLAYYRLAASAAPYADTFVTPRTKEIHEVETYRPGGIGPALYRWASSFGIGACGPSTSIDYLYVTNAKTNPGQIDIYLVDHRSGTLSAIKESSRTDRREPPEYRCDSQWQIPLRRPITMTIQ